MNAIVRRKEERGTANHGWLKANFSFSFSQYYDPSNIHFGALRVLNDDFIQGGMGFGMHPHDNMEIISVPLKGAMKHRDSMSNKWIPLEAGEVQIMSAGTGVVHSEMNNHPSEEVNLFQIWVIPKYQQVEPRYDQKTFSPEDRKNKLQVLVNSLEEEANGALQIHQDAQISRIDLDKDEEYKYELRSDNHGVFVMVISGEIEVGEYKLSQRDSISIDQVEDFKIKASSDTEVLFVEVPMQF